MLASANETSYFMSKCYWRYESPYNITLKNTKNKSQWKFIITEDDKHVV